MLYLISDFNNLLLVLKSFILCLIARRGYRIVPSKYVIDIETTESDLKKYHVNNIASSVNVWQWTRLLLTFLSGCVLFKLVQRNNHKSDKEYLKKCVKMLLRKFLQGGPRNTFEKKMSRKKANFLVELITEEINEFCFTTVLYLVILLKE